MDLENWETLISRCAGAARKENTKPELSVPILWLSSYDESEMRHQRMKSRETNTLREKGSVTRKADSVILACCSNRDAVMHSIYGLKALCIFSSG